MPSAPQRESFSPRFLGQVEQMSKTVLRQRVAWVSCGFLSGLCQRREGAKLEMELFVAKLFHPENAAVLVNTWGVQTPKERSV